MIEIRDFTGGETAGSGLFDELMRTVNSHLKSEFQSGRIAGADYGQVYLGSLTGAMQNASQFILSMERTNKEIQLMDEQILQAQKQNELIDLQKAQLVIGNQAAQYQLDNILPQEQLKITAEVANLGEQRALIQEQVSTQQKQQLDLDASTSLKGKQESLVDEQIQAATYQYTEPTAGLLFAQYTKVQKEIAVLDQKKTTEEAQTTGTSGTVGGLIGEEISLKKNQADSFIRDAEQKAAKLFADAFQIMFSVAPEAEGPSTPEYWGIDAADSQAIFDKLRAGVTGV